MHLERRQVDRQREAGTGTPFGCALLARHGPDGSVQHISRIRSVIVRIGTARR